VRALLDKNASYEQAGLLNNLQRQALRGIQRTKRLVAPLAQLLTRLEDEPGQ
jgi:hypothetical protein